MRRIRIHLLTPVLLTLLAWSAIAAEAPTRPTGIHYVYLIRHGDYGRDSTANEVAGNGLNALGREQARLIGARLAALPIHPASLVTSTYRRASETGDVIGAILKMAPARDSLIYECTPTTAREDYMRNHTSEDIALCDSNLAAAWTKWHAMDNGNASLTILAVRPDGTTRLIMFSDVGHLPLNRQSWTGKGAGWGPKPAR